MKMDIDEAIEWLYDLKHDIIYDEQAEALDMAIDSLGKQKPKKPIIKEWISIDDVELEYHCPTCGEVLVCSPERCECGQRIDWSIDWLNADYKNEVDE